MNDLTPIILGVISLGIIIYFGYRSVMRAIKNEPENTKGEKCIS